MDKPWDVVSVTRRSSGVAPRACVRVYARVLVPTNLYIHTYNITLLTKNTAATATTVSPLCACERTADSGPSVLYVGVGTNI